ncbi:MAG: hypothetical protein AAF525_23210 [Pseudomonadota bacterium]
MKSVSIIVIFLLSSTSVYATVDMLLAMLSAVSAESMLMIGLGFLCVVAAAYRKRTEYRAQSEHFAASQRVSFRKLG